MSKSIQPGDLFKAHKGGNKGLARQMEKRMKASGPVKQTGSFGGKSNALGHGGRAAQLKARGVPGGVIGNLARAAHAAPGQANFHGGKKKRKTATPEKQELGMVFKKKRKSSGSTGGQPGAEGTREMKRKHKKAKKKSA